MHVRLSFILGKRNRGSKFVQKVGDSAVDMAEQFHARSTDYAKTTPVTEPEELERALETG